MKRSWHDITYRTRKVSLSIILYLLFILACFILMLMFNVILHDTLLFFALVARCLHATVPRAVRMEIFLPGATCRANRTPTSGQCVQAFRCT